MVRNAIESDFWSPKMGGGGASKWPACKPFGDIHSICPWANAPILVRLWFCLNFLALKPFLIFFRRQGFQTITFERQGSRICGHGSWQKEEVYRSPTHRYPHVRGGGGGGWRPRTPQNVPPSKILYFLRFRTTGTFIEKKKL